MNTKKNTHGAQHSAKPAPTYTGSALAKQDPAAKLSRSQKIDLATQEVASGLERMATLLSADVPLPVLEACYFVIDKVWAKPIKQMRDLINGALKAHMREQEQPLVELTLDYSGSTYRAERKVVKHSMGSAPGMADVEELAKRAGLKKDDLLRQLVSYEFDDDKLRAYVTAGKIKPEWVEECRVQKAEQLTIEKV